MIDCSKFIWSLFRQISDDQIQMLWPQKVGEKKNVQKVKSPEPEDYDVDDLDLSEPEEDRENCVPDEQQVQTTTKDFNWIFEGLRRFPEFTEEMKNKMQIYFTMVLISIFSLF
jgi:hypothetical protein